MEFSSTTLDYYRDAILLQYYGWWQLVTCLFAFIALSAIWWHIGKKQNDHGPIWLALSVLCWSISGLVEVYYADVLLEPFDQLKSVGLSATNSSIQSIIEGIDYKNMNAWKSILSLFNSLFILLTLPCFRYLPKPLEKIIMSDSWKYIIGLPFVFALLPILSSIFMDRKYGIARELDVYYAVLTLIFLGYVLFSSFQKRQLPFLAGLSILSILITFIAQVYKLIDSDINQLLFSACFKTTLIMIFFALAMSWVKELSESIFPDPRQLQITLSKTKNEQGKWKGQVQIIGLRSTGPKTFELTSSLFDLLQTFVSKRIERHGEGWLEIKPKNDLRDKTYDINDHNQIKRLSHALLDGIFGEAHWNKNVDEPALRECLFEMSEKRDRKIRLRLKKDHLSIES
jgi:hypothetical protein